MNLTGIGIIAINKRLLPVCPGDATVVFCRWQLMAYDGTNRKVISLLLSFCRATVPLKACDGLYQRSTERLLMISCGQRGRYDQSKLKSANQRGLIR